MFFRMFRPDDDPRRWERVREITRIYLERQAQTTPDRTIPASALPNPEPATPGRMSAAQRDKARVSAGDYWKHVAAEHDEA